MKTPVERLAAYFRQCGLQPARIDEREYVTTMTFFVGDRDDEYVTVAGSKTLEEFLCVFRNHHLAGAVVLTDFRSILSWVVGNLKKMATRTKDGGEDVEIVLRSEARAGREVPAGARAEEPERGARSREDS